MSDPLTSETAMPNTSLDKIQDNQAAGQKVDEFVRTVLGAFMIAMVIRMFVFEPFNIPSSSMVPSLLIGDYLFVSKYSYGYSSLSTTFGLFPSSGKILAREPERGDVAVFKLPTDPHTDYIKRVVGLPGDTLQMRQGLLYINGVPVDRQRLPERTETNYLTPRSSSVDYVETLPEQKRHIIREDGDDLSLDNTDVFKVPEGHYFMMGDNRDNSRDSRTNLVGFVPADHLVGRAEMIFFSMDEGTRFWEIWKWPAGVRWGRIFKKIK